MTGDIHTKMAATPFALKLVAIAGNAVAAGFDEDVKVELLANTGVLNDASGAGACPALAVALQSLGVVRIGPNGFVNTAVIFHSAVAARDVRVRVSWPATGTPSVVNCSTDNFALRPASFTVTSSASNTQNLGDPVFRAGIAPFNLTATTTAGYTGTPALNTQMLYLPALAAVCSLPPAATAPMVLVAQDCSNPGNSQASSRAGALSGGAFTPATDQNGLAVADGDHSFLYDEVGNPCLSGFRLQPRRGSPQWLSLFRPDVSGDARRGAQRPAWYYAELQHLREFQPWQPCLGEKH
ncbi:MAG: hypothetical protein LBE62_15765 [Azonexus sp.]|nr:hypothetical protein [Azonexus sp.]